MLKSIGLIVCLISLINCCSGDTINSLKSKRFCENLPAQCSCIDKRYYKYSCTHDESNDKTVFRMVFFQFNSQHDWINFECISVPSFKKLPDFTNYIKDTRIQIVNCIINDKFYEFTNKISNNVKHLKLFLLMLDERNQNFNEHFFEGLSQLRILDIKIMEYTVVNANIFENLINLKTLIINNLSTQNGIFDKLNQLTFLTIINKKIELEVGVFNNQTNLVELNLYCYQGFSLDSRLFANLTNLEILKIVGNVLLISPEELFKHNHKLKSIKLSFEMNYPMTQDQSALVNLKSVAKNVTKNKLKSILKELFVDQIRLEKLDLSYNRLEELSDGLFDTTVNMRTLILGNNLLTNISRLVKKN